jgi:predicted DNA-binding transcriptional regulator AlpA
MTLSIEPLIQIEELGNLLGITRYNIYKKIKRSNFPKGYKLNGKRFFKPSEIQSYYSDLGISIKFES